MIKNFMPIAIVIFLLGFVLSGCYDIKRTDKVSQYNQIEHHVVAKDKGVNLTMNASYSEGEMKIKLINNGSKKLFFGTPYTIEKQKDGKWYQTKYTYNKGFNDVGITIKPDEKYTQKAELKMPEGHYRVIKQLSSSFQEPDDITIGDPFTVGD